MRFIFTTLLIAALAALLSRFLPWWIVAVVAAAVAFILKLRGGMAFGAGFVAIFAVWLISYLILDHDHVLSGRLAQVFYVKSPYLFMIVAAFVGGLVGGLSALSGSLLRRAGSARPPRRLAAAKVIQ